MLKHRSLLIVALFAGVAAHAQNTFTVEAGPWNVYQGTTKLPGDHATREACAAAASLLPLAAGAVQRYGCRTIASVVVTGAAAAPPPAPAPAPSPAPAPAPAPTPAPPPGAQVVYLSPSGNNANPGTQASPKRDFGGVDINTLPAGSQVLLERGGTWANVSLNLRNLNATPVAPIVLDAYGTGAAPTLQVPSGQGVIFGSYSDTTPDGGYTIRNLKFDGRGTGQWGFFIIGETRNVTIEANEITGFEIAVHAQNMGETGNQALVVRNNYIHHNREMGMLGDAYGLVFDGNLVEANNFSGSGFNHGLYLGGHATNGRVTNNRFVNNSLVNGVCTGGNLTVHGQWDGLLIEGNIITVPQAVPGCYGVSVTDGYNSVEFFRNVIVRGNTISQVESAIVARAAPSIVVEGNKVRSNQAIASGVVISPPPNTTDDRGLNPVVRGNLFCLEHPDAGAPVRISVAGGSESTSATLRGAEARSGACTP